MAPKLRSATSPARSRAKTKVDAAAASTISATDTAAAQRAGRIIAVGAATSNLLQGYSTGVVGNALLFIVPEFALEERPAVQGLIVSVTTLGSMAGTLGGRGLSDYLGRRKTLLVSSVLFVAAGLLLSWAPTVGHLLVGRALLGVAIGNAGAVTPVYIAECAEASSRGALATLPQLFISSGVLCSYLVSLAVTVTGGSWRFMMGLQLVLAAVQMLAVAALPESPRWLLHRGKTEAAATSLARLRGVPPPPLPPHVASELADLQTGLQKEQQAAAAASAQPVASGWATLLEPSLRKPLALCVALQFLQQFVGINAVVYYGPMVLREAGVPLLFAPLGLGENAASQLATVLAYVPKIPTLFCTMMLMDRWGRRPLLQVFVPALAACNLALAAALSLMGDGTGAYGQSFAPKLMAVGATTLYGCAHALSLGPIPNIVTAESFPIRARAAAMSASLSAQFLFAALIGMGFPLVRLALGSQAVFLGFAAVCIGSWPLLRHVPEMSGKGLEQQPAEEKQR